MHALIVAGAVVATGADPVELARIGEGDIVPVPSDPAWLDYVAGEWVPAAVRIGDDLCGRIDVAANALIEAAVTPGAGIQAAREDKRRELERWDADGDARVVNAMTYPFVMAEALAKGVDPLAVIEEIRAAVAQWLYAGAQVEAVRVAGKVGVRSAGSVGDMQAAASAVLAALAAMRGA